MASGLEFDSSGGRQLLGGALVQSSAIGSFAQTDSVAASHGYDQYSILVLEYMLQWNSEYSSDLERRLQRRGIAALLDRDDRLPCQTDTIGEFLLRHLLVMESQYADVVANARVRPSHGQTPNR